MKKAILIVSFGTTHHDALEACITAVEQRIQKEYPDMVCYRAFTSGMIMEILRKRDGIFVDNVEEAMTRMRKDGVTHIYIQPTHIIDGIENNKMKQVLERFSDEFQQIITGAPLLFAEEDYSQVVKAVWEELSDQVNEELLIFMGHGSEHKSNEAYVRLEEEFRRQKLTNVFVATVEAEPDLDMVIEHIKTKNRKKVILTPFMLVAGDHAKNDMAGEEDSFYSRLSELGYDVTCIVKGLGEYQSIQNIFLQHLKAVM